MSATACPDQRVKARVRPSGENAGSVSKCPAGGDVNSRSCRLAIETKQTRYGPFVEALSTTAISFPSGDHAKLRPTIKSKKSKLVCRSWRSGPPNDGTES